jgi:hypothetical protein
MTPYTPSGELITTRPDPSRPKNGKFAWILDPDGNKVELWPMLWDDKNKQ